MALHGMSRLDEAEQEYQKGLQYDPENAQIKQGLAKCQQDLQAGSDPLGGMFGPEQMAKLMTNPKTAAYFSDPQFRSLFEMCKQNPQMLTQVMQMDPRFQDILGVMLGVDLS